MGFFKNKKQKANELALLYWEHFPNQKDAICDHCSKTIKRNRGYAVEPSALLEAMGEFANMPYTPSLICSSCFDKSPDAKPCSKSKLKKYLRKAK
jgi:hypothetical protein